MKHFKQVFVNANDGLSGIANARGDLYNDRGSWRLVTDKDHLKEIEKEQVVIYALEGKSGKMREVTRKTALKHL
jgi:hypothetical protein